MSVKSHLTSRRRFIATTTLVASSLATIKPGLPQPTPQASGEADFLFVQSSKGLTFDRSTNKLTLTGVSPVTVFFTDRPERIAGNMKTASFIPFWSEGKDSLKSNPPNGDISLLNGKTLNQIVVELQDPVLSGDNLTYTVKLLQGEMPAQANDVSVFIDIIGRPLTPLWVWQVLARRRRRIRPHSSWRRRPPPRSPREPAVGRDGQKRKRNSAIRRGRRATATAPRIAMAIKKFAASGGCHRVAPRPHVARV